METTHPEMFSHSAVSLNDIDEDDIDPSALHAHPNKRLKTGESGYVAVGAVDGVSTPSTIPASLHSPDDSAAESTPARGTDSHVGPSHTKAAISEDLLMAEGDEIDLVDDDDDDDGVDDDEKSISISISVTHSVAGQSTIYEGAVEDEVSVAGSSRQLAELSDTQASAAQADETSVEYGSARAAEVSLTQPNAGETVVEIPNDRSFDRGMATKPRSKQKSGRTKRQGTSAVTGTNKRNKKRSEPLESEEQRMARLMDAKRQEIARVKEYIILVQQLNRLVRSDSGENLGLLRAFLSVMSEIYEEIASEVILEVHKKVVTNDLDLLNDLAFSQVAVTPNVEIDIFGQDFSSYTPEPFLCDQGCGRQISANRYAPHLEKCSNLSTARVGSARRTRANEVNYEEPPDQIIVVDSTEESSNTKKMKKRATPLPPPPLLTNNHAGTPPPTVINPGPHSTAATTSTTPSGALHGELLQFMKHLPLASTQPLSATPSSQMSASSSHLGNLSRQPPSNLIMRVHASNGQLASGSSSIPVAQPNNTRPPSHSRLDQMQFNFPFAPSTAPPPSQSTNSTGQSPSILRGTQPNSGVNHLAQAGLLNQLRAQVGNGQLTPVQHQQLLQQIQQGRTAQVPNPAQSLLLHPSNSATPQPALGSQRQPQISPAQSQAQTHPPPQTLLQSQLPQQQLRPIQQLKQQGAHPSLTSTHQFAQAGHVHLPQSLVSAQSHRQEPGIPVAQKIQPLVSSSAGYGPSVPTVRFSTHAKQVSPSQPQQQSQTQRLHTTTPSSTTTSLTASPLLPPPTPATSAAPTSSSTAAASTTQTRGTTMAPQTMRQHTIMHQQQHQLQQQQQAQLYTEQLLSKLTPSQTAVKDFLIAQHGPGIWPYIEQQFARPLPERVRSLSKKCGVISLKTSKMCTKSLKCPQHDDWARYQFRILILGEQEAKAFAPEVLAKQRQSESHDKSTPASNHEDMTAEDLDI